MNARKRRIYANCGIGTPAAARRLEREMLSNDAGRVCGGGGIYGWLCTRGGEASGGAVVEATVYSRCSSVDRKTVRLNGGWDSLSLLDAYAKCRKWRRAMEKTREAQDALMARYEAAGLPQRALDRIAAAGEALGFPVEYDEMGPEALEHWGLALDAALAARAKRGGRNPRKRKGGTP